MSGLNCVSLIAELIYKEVLDWEERTKNGVIRGQSASIGQWSFTSCQLVKSTTEMVDLSTQPVSIYHKGLLPPPASVLTQV